MRPRRRLVALGAVATAPVLVEAVALRLAHLTATAALASQVTAPEPFGTLHDLRWILVYSTTWAVVVAEAVGWLVVRTALVVVLARLAWPAGVPRPPLAVSARRAAVGVAVAGAAMAPWAGVQFALGVVSLSWLFYAATGAAAVVAVLLHLAPLEDGWWRHPPTLRSLGWIAAAWCAVTITGGLLSIGPPWAAIPAALVAGAANVVAWRGVVRATVTRAPARTLAVAPLGMAALVVAVVLGVVIGVNVHRPFAPAAGPGEAYHAGAGRPALVVAGFATSWDGTTPTPLGPGVDAWRFSYRGLDDAGRPLPYTAADTEQSVATLARLLATQVDALHAVTGRRVALVAESEGTVVTETYLAGTADPPVDDAVLLSPIVEPGRVYAPPHGQNGWGLAGGAELDALGAALHSITAVDVGTETPLLRSFVTGAPELRTLFACPRAGIHQLAMVPLGDAVSAPIPQRITFDLAVVPAFHGGLLGTPRVDRAIADVLADRWHPAKAPWRAAARLIQLGAAAWQPPELPFQVNPAWASAGNPTRCAAVRASVARWLHAKG